MDVPRRHWQDVRFSDRQWAREAGRFILSFQTELPFEIPLKPDEQWVFWIEQANELPGVTANHAGICLGASSHPPRIPQHLSILPDWEAFVANFRRFARSVRHTFCEFMVVPTADWAPTVEILTRCFDQGLAALNSFLVEYEIATMDHTVHQVAKEDLPSLALMTFKDRKAPYYAHNYIRLHDLDGVEKTPVPGEVRTNIEGRLAQEREPAMATYHRERVKAQRLPDQGRYSEAVLAAATAIEALVAWLLTRRTAESASAFERPVEEIMLGSIVAIVKNRLIWLDGNWDPGDPSSPSSVWKRNVADLRNAVVHRGASVSYRQARTATSAAGQFSRYVFDRLESSGRKEWLGEARTPTTEVVVGVYHWEHDRFVPLEQLLQSSGG